MEQLVCASAPSDTLVGHPRTLASGYAREKTPACREIVLVRLFTAVVRRDLSAERTAIPRKQRSYDALIHAIPAGRPRIRCARARPVDPTRQEVLGRVGVAGEDGVELIRDLVVSFAKTLRIARRQIRDCGFLSGAACRLVSGFRSSRAERS